MKKIFNLGAAAACLCILTYGIAACSNYAAGLSAKGSISTTRGEMISGRAAHTATLLEDGRVLIVGGMRSGGGSLNDAEMFDSSTTTFSSAGKLNTPRSGHTSTLLPNGKVLVAGGYNGGYLQTSEIFDPAANRFEPGPPLTLARSEHTATVLSNGTVLLTGGVGAEWTFLSASEIFDPETGKFTAAGSMASPRESHTATLLKNGKVLVTGGHKGRRAAITIYSSTELYDPARRTWEPGPAMIIRRHKHDAAVLRDGRIVVMGGSDEKDSQGAYTSVEIYDPHTNRFSSFGEMQSARYKLNGAAVVLEDGSLLIAGGSDRAEIFDPHRRVSEPVSGTFGSKRLFSTATRLRNGEVLITGGYNEVLAVSRQAWIYRRPM